MIPIIYDNNEGNGMDLISIMIQNKLNNLMEEWIKDETN
jgi:hypothetical protein